jgi:class 3 adenylate cyclase
VDGGARASEGSVLVVDDQEANVTLLADLLHVHGFAVERAASGEEALATIERHAPDIVLLDVMMPGLSGLDVCQRLRADPRHRALPIILVTSLDPEKERIRGLEAGADDFLAKPVNVPELLARVRSQMRVKRLLDQTQAQAAELALLNAELQRRVDEKVNEITRLSRLRRFLTPHLAERIVAGGPDDPLQSHRRDIVVVFFDVRGFTAFSERNAPEDVMSVLHELHQVVGTQTHRFHGTIERFVGDGVMVFFNDPEPIEAPCAVAVRYAAEVMRACDEPIERWRRNDFGISLGSGIAYGFATLGAIGFADRMDYGAIGSVSNLAARLCSEAKGGEILMSKRVAAALPANFRTALTGPWTLKGFRDPVDAFRLVAIEPDPLASSPNAA